MNTTNEQYVQVPHMDLKELHLEKTDPLVYACIKKYKNKDTNKAFPSITTLVRDSGLHKSTVLEAIKRLEAANMLIVEKRNGTSNIYTFTSYENFECFSYDFLNCDFSSIEKSYLVILQTYMYKNNETLSGTIWFPCAKIANILSVTIPTVYKIEKSLQERGVLSIRDLNKVELLKVNNVVIPSTGLHIKEREYDFEKYFNAIACRLQEHDEILDDHSELIKELQEANAKNELEIKELNKKINDLLNASNQKIILN